MNKDKLAVRNQQPGRRNVLKGTLAVAVAPALITSANAQAKVVWKCQTHWPKASTSYAGSALVVAKELEKRTDGRFKLEALGAGELARGPEIFNFVSRGVVPMGSISPSYILGEAEVMGIYAGIPGALRHPWEMEYLVKNLGLEAAVNEELRAKSGVFLMGNTAAAFELVLKKKIEPDANLAGIKLRSAGNLLKYLAAAGFAAQYIAGAEIYPALQTGVVDGANWGGTQGALSMKLWEVAPIHMKPALVIANEAYLVNQAAYEALPNDLRMIFTSLLEEHYYLRTNEYTRSEAVALSVGTSKMGVKVEHFSDGILESFAKASRAILAEEMAKGPKAKAMGEKLIGLQKELGYI